MSGAPARWWRWEGEQIACSLCPRNCRVKPGQRAFCFSRMGTERGMVLTDPGRSSGYCLDPIASMPLFHFRPGGRMLAFGTIGCNLACSYCQNWDIARAESADRLLDAATPAQVVDAARRLDCVAIGLSFNDPVIWAEQAIEMASTAREAGVAVVAKTAAYIGDEARAELFGALDAVSVDLKSMREDFYRRVCSARLGPVLDTLRYVAHETTAWLEVVTLLVSGQNDSDQELAELAEFVAGELGVDVPLHLNAYSPEHRMRAPATTADTLLRAQRRAREAGLRYVYSGELGGAPALDTSCPGCGQALIRREGFQVLENLVMGGLCPACGATIAGHLAPPPVPGVPRRFGLRLGAETPAAPAR